MGFRVCNEGFLLKSCGTYVYAGSRAPFQIHVNASSSTSSASAQFPTGDPVETSSYSKDARDKSSPKASDDLETMEEQMSRIRELVESVDMLEKIDWLADLPDNPENKEALDIIFREGMTYCRTFMDGTLLPWVISDWPLNPRVWLAEMERTLKAMAKKNWLPYWLRRPHDRNIRTDAGESAKGFSDPGNYVLDVMVHALRLWNYTEASRADMVRRQTVHEYGSRANMSAHGPVNLRGNIIEAMTKNLQEAGSSNIRFWQKYDPVWYWYEWPRQETDQPRQWPQVSHGRRRSMESWRAW